MNNLTSSVSQLAVIPVMDYHGKTSMKYLYEELTNQLYLLQSENRFNLVKVQPPSVMHSTWSNKYYKYLTYHYTKHVKYPFIVRNLETDYFLLTDHSYGHLVKHLPGSRTVAFCHDLIPLEVSGLLKSRAERFLYKNCVQGLRDSKFVIAISNFTKSLLEKHLELNPANIRVVPLGISEKFKPVELDKPSFLKQKLKNYNGETLILHVGHCAYYKNIECLLEILYLLNLKSPGKFRLIKIGGPFKSDQCKLIEKWDLHNLISQYQDITIDELVQFYNSCDILVMPSFMEGQGLPILEAFKCKLPVICSDIEVFHEIAKDAAVFIDPKKPWDWVDYIIGINSFENHCRPLVDKGNVISQKFSWKQCAADVMNIFKELGL